MTAYFSGCRPSTCLIRETASVWACVSQHRPEIAWAQHCNLLQTKSNKKKNSLMLPLLLSASLSLSPAAFSCGSAWHGCNMPSLLHLQCSQKLSMKSIKWWFRNTSRRPRKHCVFSFWCVFNIYTVETKQSNPFPSRKATPQQSPYSLKQSTWPPGALVDLLRSRWDTVVVASCEFKCGEKKQNEESSADFPKSARCLDRQPAQLKNKLACSQSKKLLLDSTSF